MGVLKPFDGLKPEFYGLAFGDRELLQESDIQLLNPWASFGVYAAVPKMACGPIRHGAGVGPDVAAA